MGTLNEVATLSEIQALWCLPAALRDIAAQAEWLGLAQPWGTEQPRMNRFLLEPPLVIAYVNPVLNTVEN